MCSRANPGLPQKKGLKNQAFTLVEMMVAATLLIIIIGIVLRMTNQTAKVWKDSNSKIQSFQEARAGFESMTRKLGQATLNTYYDYYDSTVPPKSRSSYTTAATLAAFVPSTYDRISDLHFISGQANTLLSGSGIVTQTQAVFFQAPLGYSVTYQKLNNALNACGYFIQFGDASSVVPDYYKTSPAYKARWRFRLMEMMQSTENLTVYPNPAASPAPGANDWFVKNAATNSRIVAENVIALVILPKLSDRDDDPSKTGMGVGIAPNYNYNSRISLGATVDSSWSSASPAFPGDSFTSYPAKGGSLTVTRHHQLPPLLQVVMIVIDEPSAQKIQGSGSSVPAAINLANISPPLFTDATKLASDIQKVEDICNAKAGNLTNNTTPLVYRVFTSDILMKEAKWSNK